MTDAESECFRIARAYQRRFLARELLHSDYRMLKQRILRIHLSANKFTAALQISAFVLLFPLILVMLALRFYWRLVLFPFRLWATYWVPKELSAPGEKNLVGMHNAFGGYVEMTSLDYVSCMDHWIGILYNQRGRYKAQVLALADRFVGVTNAQGFEALLDSSIGRHILALSREQLSKELGHYGVFGKQRSAIR